MKRTSCLSLEKMVDGEGMSIWNPNRSKNMPGLISTHTQNLGLISHPGPSL